MIARDITDQISADSATAAEDFQVSLN